MRIMHRDGTRVKTDRESVEWALERHRKDGKIISWRQIPGGRDEVTQANEMTSWEIVVNNGDTLRVSLHEAHAVVMGMASASHRN